MVDVSVITLFTGVRGVSGITQETDLNRMLQITFKIFFLDFPIFFGAWSQDYWLW